MNAIITIPPKVSLIIVSAEIAKTISKKPKKLIIANTEIIDAEIHNIAAVKKLISMLKICKV